MRHIDSAKVWYTNAIEDGAIEWFIEKAEEGVPQIQAQLGYCYDNGIGVEKDENKGLHWARQSAENGNALGQFNLGFHFEGMNDMEKAVEYYTKSANQGFVYAQYNLGRIYEINFHDEKNAMFWYEKAANQGYSLSQSFLATLYLGRKLLGSDNTAVMEKFLVYGVSLTLLFIMFTVFLNMECYDKKLNPFLHEMLPQCRMND